MYFSIIELNWLLFISVWLDDVFIILFNRYLIEKGAKLDAVNNDGELAVDLAEGKQMEILLSNSMEDQGKYTQLFHFLHNFQHRKPAVPADYGP